MRFFHTFLRLFGSLCLPWLNLALGPQLKKLVRSFCPPLYWVLSDPCEHLPHTQLVFVRLYYTFPFYIYKWSCCPCCLSLFFQEFLCRDDFIPASLRSQHFTCKDMMKEAWLLCFDEFQVTHISSSCFEALEVFATWCDCILRSSRLPETRPFSRKN